VSQHAVRQETQVDDFQVRRCVANAEAFGAIIDFLTRVKPFSQVAAGQLASIVRDQLKHQHHVCAMRGNTIIGYCGWVLVTPESGEQWLRDQGPLRPVPEAGATAGALTLVRADDPKVLRRLIRVTRDLNPGRRVFLRRDYSDGSKTSRLTSVLNVPHARKGRESVAE